MIEAFKNGYTLLLDEINLASNQVLQSFEECKNYYKNEIHDNCKKNKNKSAKC